MNGRIRSGKHVQVGFEGMNGMAISAVGGSNAQALLALQRQLQADQRQLAEDLKANAGQRVISADQAKIVLDQSQLSAIQQNGSVDLYL